MKIVEENGQMEEKKYNTLVRSLLLQLKIGGCSIIFLYIYRTQAPFCYRLFDFLKYTADNHIQDLKTSLVQVVDEGEREKTTQFNICS